MDKHHIVVFENPSDAWRWQSLQFASCDIKVSTDLTLPASTPALFIVHRSRLQGVSDFTLAVLDGLKLAPVLVVSAGPANLPPLCARDANLQLVQSGTVYFRQSPLPKEKGSSFTRQAVEQFAQLVRVLLDKHISNPSQPIQWTILEGYEDPGHVASRINAWRSSRP